MAIRITNFLRGHLPLPCVSSLLSMVFFATVVSLAPICFSTPSIISSMLPNFLSNNSSMKVHVESPLSKVVANNFSPYSSNYTVALLNLARNRLRILLVPWWMSRRCARIVYFHQLAKSCITNLLEKFLEVRDPPDKDVDEPPQSLSFNVPANIFQLTTSSLPLPGYLRRRVRSLS